MFKLGVSLLLLATLAVRLNADQIVPAALTKIFKYATPASVKTLTNQINKQTTKPKAKAALNAWAPKNWKAADATLDSKDNYSKQAYATNKASTFIDMRYSLKKYINYMYNQAVSSKYMTAAEATKLKKLFWDADTKNKNNYTLTCQTVAVEGTAAFNKTPALTTKIKEVTTAFAQANPTDYSNLQWTL